MEGGGKEEKEGRNRKLSFVSFDTSNRFSPLKKNKDLLRRWAAVSLGKQLPSVSLSFFRNRMVVRARCSGKPTAFMQTNLAGLNSNTSVAKIKRRLRLRGAEAGQSSIEEWARGGLRPRRVAREERLWDGGLKPKSRQTGSSSRSRASKQASTLTGSSVGRVGLVDRGEMGSEDPRTEVAGEGRRGGARSS